jgi:tetratricopeptide (TPR) repeat protein
MLLSATAWPLDWVVEKPTPPEQSPPTQPVEQPPAQPDESQPITVEHEEPTTDTVPPLDWQESLDMALAAAKQQNKPVFIEFFVTYQQWCRILDEKTLTDTGVVELSHKFACARIDGKDSPDLTKKYGVKSYPTVVYLNAKGEIIDRAIGFIPAQPFLRQMKEIANGREPEKEFEKLVRSRPADFRSLVVLGIGYQKRNEFDKAIESYEKALAVGPGYESEAQQQVVYALCPLYDFRGKPEKSEKLLLNLLNAKESDKVKVHDMLGQTYLSLKKPEKAIEQIEAERELLQDEKQKEFLDRMIEQIRNTARK